MKRTFDGALNVRVINDFLNISGGDINVDMAAIGTPNDPPTENTAIGLLKNQKNSLVSIYEQDHAINQNTSSIGSTNDDSDDETVIGILKNEKSNLISLKATVGSTADLATQSTVIGLLKSIIHTFD